MATTATAVRALMVVNEVAATLHGTRVKLNAIMPADPGDQEEIKRYFEATPQGWFEALIRNELAAEQFQPGDKFYVTLERKVD